MEFFRLLLNRKLNLDDENWNALNPFLRSRLVPKKSLILEQGTADDSIFYILEGSFRSYTIAEDGREWVKSFALEHEFVASMSTLTSASPSPFCIQALEEARVISFRWQDVKQIPYCQKMREMAAYKLLHKLERRHLDYQQFNPEQRYRHFLEHSPDLNRRVADLHIASFLGMTPVHLSRLRRKISQPPCPGSSPPES